MKKTIKIKRGEIQIQTGLFLGIGICFEEDETDFNYYIMLPFLIVGFYIVKKKKVVWKK